MPNITNNCTILSEQVAKSGEILSKLGEESMLLSIMEGKTTKHYRLVTAAGDKLIVFCLAMNSLMGRVTQLVQEIKEDPSNDFRSIHFQKIYRDMYAVEKVSREAVGNMGRLTALEEETSSASTGAQQ